MFRAVTSALLAASLTLLLASPAAARGWGLDDYLADHPVSNWDGYGVGSMIHLRTTQVVNIPQMPEPQRQVTERKKTLVEATDTTLKFKVETLMGGVWTTTEETEPRRKALAAEVVDAGTETVTVAGTDYDCTKKRVKWNQDGTLKEDVVLWVHETAGILKMQTQLAEQGQQGSTLVATALDKEWTVGSETVKGREWAMSVAGPTGPIEGKVGISLDVPDTFVRQDVAGSQGPVTFTVVTELVAVVRK